MKWLSALLLSASALQLAGAQTTSGYTVPPGSPGYYYGNSTQAIQFDAKSLYVDGERVFVYGGEFHPWRLPVPELWTDILQKFKAAGFNTVSIYTHWGAVEHKRGTVEWTYFRDVELFYQIAERVGIYVIARPGPYINAETTGGGFPGWLTNIADVGRTADPGYIAAFQNYVKSFSAITHKYQYPAGPVIAVQAENEFYDDTSFNTTSSEQMAQLVATFRANGIDRVPITHNDVYPSGHFATGLGQVDWYGFDGYPNGFDCANPAKWNELPNYFKSGHDAVAPWTPLYVAEFQGGAFDSWSGNGYDKCYQLTGPEFVNVFWKDLVADGSKSFSGYMLYGGTNWGNLPNPGQYSSYDYGAAIREARLITPKYNEMKLQGLFYQASPSLYGTEVLDTGAGAPFADNSAVFTTHLGTTGNSTNYYIVRQISNNVTTPTSFKLTVNTTLGALTIPQYGGQITLDGRETKTLVTEYPFGKNVLKYSTAEILTQATIDGTDYLVLYVPAGQSVEAVISTGSAPSITGSSSISAKLSAGSVIISGTASGASYVKFGSTIVLVLDKVTATAFWQPRLAKTADASPKTPSVLVGGPHLVRNATIAGSTLALVGDTNTTTPLTVIAPAAVKSVTWNGKSVSVKKGAAGELTGSVTGPQALTDLPKLTSRSWKAADSIPEADPKFDDSKFVVATKTSVARKQKPYAGKYVLYASEYGFHQGSFVFRGHFNGTATGVNLTVQGGNYFGFLAYLNGKFLGSGQGLNGTDQVNATFTFPAGSVTSGNNVFTVVMDSQGLNDDWVSDDSFKTPRGIRGYTLLGGGDFSVWKLTGNLGGEDFPDKVRGGLNEGGIWADRVGAILPGYPDGSWKASSPFTGITKPGIQAYRTKFNLGIQAGTDVPLALKFTQTPGSNYRVIIYVNGWQFGKFINNVGPQTVFPIPEGIINHRGVNELVITLWALDSTGAKIADLELVSLANFASGKEVTKGNVVRSPTFQELR